MPLEAGTLLPPTALASVEELVRLVREHRIAQVVDLSSIDSVDCARTCNERGTHFLCSSAQECPGQGSIPTNEAIARLLTPRRPALNRGSHFVGSGATPGIVDALAFGALDASADRVAVAPRSTRCDVHAVLITEEVTTTAYGAPPSDDVFSMSWSPTHCFEELFEPRALAARGGRVDGPGHRPTARWYRAQCGDHPIEGITVPHEEIATLAWRLPGVEIGVLSRTPSAARRALAAHPGRDSAEEWDTQRLCPPWSEALPEHDRVGAQPGRALVARWKRRVGACANTACGRHRSLRDAPIAGRVRYHSAVACRGLVRCATVTALRRPRSLPALPIAD